MRGFLRECVSDAADIWESWQYIMLAAAICLAVIFCCYYIVNESGSGFYGEAEGGGTSTGRIEREAEGTESAANNMKIDIAEDDGTEADGTEADGEAVNDGAAADGEAVNEDTASDGGTVNSEPKHIKRAYLTFDDGPSGNTEEILDILDANGVKATFFVVGRGEEYYDTYRDIVSRGHTLGIHSYSHDYDKMYASLTDFAEDVEELRNLLYDVTGVRCIYYRFPGGSSNTVSRVDMDTLISYIEEQGLVYFDWNALNGDAVSGSYMPEQLVQNVMNDAVKYDDTVILMHDLDGRHTTVESLQMLIDRLREEGYELLPIDENTPLVRHSW